MGLLASVFGNGNTIKNRKKNRNFRVCRIEEVEPRVMLSANSSVFVPPEWDDINFGIVFHDSGCHVDPALNDVQRPSHTGTPDSFTISWNGGVQNDTWLHTLVIDLQGATYNSEFALFFEEGTFYCNDSRVSGVISNHLNEDGTLGQTLTLTFSQDVDTEGLKFFVSVVMRYHESGQNHAAGAINPALNGNVFQGTTIEATFKSSDYEDRTFDDIFKHQYDNPDDKSLNLPTHDECEHDGGTGATTAGAIVADKGTPDLKTGTISGRVYDDKNGDGAYDDGEGIDDVEVSLYRWVWNEELGEGEYEFVETVSTSDGGHYVFDEVDAFQKYKIQVGEHEGYECWATEFGDLDGKEKDLDTIGKIPMKSAQDLDGYNFIKYKEGLIEGYVYVDVNKDGWFYEGATGIPGEPGISEVTLQLWVQDENEEYVKVTHEKDGEEVFYTVTTGLGGYYAFKGLKPGTYKVEIVDGHPDYICFVVNEGDGHQRFKEEEGDLDAIEGIVIFSGTEANEYNFGKVKEEVELPKPPGCECPPPGEPTCNCEDKQCGCGGGKTCDCGGDGNCGCGDGTTCGCGGGKTCDCGGDGNCGCGDDTTCDCGGDGNCGCGDDTTCSCGDTSCSCTGDCGCSSESGEKGEQGEQGEKGDPGPTGPAGRTVSVGSPPSSFTPATPTVGAGAWASPGAGGWYAPSQGEQLRTGFGSGPMAATGAPTPALAWNLSVINAGYPRANGATDGITVGEHASRTTMILSEDGENPANGARYVSVSWTPLPMKQSGWYIRGKDGVVRKRFTFGPDGGTPVVGDFSGDGIARIAVYHEGNWYIDLNGNGEWDEEDLWVEMGGPYDQPVAGDWDGDGKTDIGTFGPTRSGDAQIIAAKSGLPTDLNATVAVKPKNVPPDISINVSMNSVRAMKHSQSGGVRLDVMDHVFQYGNEGDKGFTGDFTGDGIATIGVYRDGKWYIDRTGTGDWDENAVLVNNADFGLGPDGIPVIGDFSGDGIDKIGLYVNGVWHLDTTGDFRFDTRIEFGEPGDYPVVGDFDGSGIAQLAVYRASTNENPLMASIAPEPAIGGGAGMVAREFGSDADSQPDQEALKHQGRTVATPHTNAPLLRGR